MRTSVLMGARVRVPARARACVALCVCQHLAGAGGGWAAWRQEGAANGQQQRRQAEGAGKTRLGL